MFATKAILKRSNLNLRLKTRVREIDLPWTIRSRYNFHRHRYGFEIRNRPICRELSQLLVHLLIQNNHFTDPELEVTKTVKWDRSNNITCHCQYQFISHGIWSTVKAL